MPLRYPEGYHSVGGSPMYPMRQFKAQNVELVIHISKSGYCWYGI